MIRVFIGTEPAQKLACEVLKYSIKARATEPVEFTEIGGTSWAGLTGFSFARWQVPELCEYKGSAIYLDADIVALADIVELCELTVVGGALARPTADGRYFTSVMALDCALGWRFDQLVEQARRYDWMYSAIMWAASNSPVRADFAALPRRWNDLDRVKGDTALLHYTDLKRQPWRYAGHPFGYVFQAELKSALADGAVSRALIDEQINAGHVRGDVLLTP